MYAYIYTYVHTHIPIRILETYESIPIPPIPITATGSSLPSSIPRLHLTSTMRILAPNNTKLLICSNNNPSTSFRIAYPYHYKNKPRKYEFKICFLWSPATHHTWGYTVKHIFCPLITWIRFLPPTPSPFQCRCYLFEIQLVYLSLLSVLGYFPSFYSSWFKFWM